MTAMGGDIKYKTHYGRIKLEFRSKSPHDKQQKKEKRMPLYCFPDTLDSTF